ncbi:uncharacterized protein LOC125676430 isoform X2 [Ostrea edulis]|uniref:uncharacterized protein LOC125676430 isoform X2 n=1 Tax=Ostrea edulis TaxID=37623 RepID=UPI0024AF27BF|nr:uncharacterized protein LOC125676430 isoform X2 [Ostrea edulis]
MDPYPFLSIFLHVSILVKEIYPKALTCPATIPTVTYVGKCPSNEKEWKIAAEEKRCDKLAKYQNCSSPEDFVYHCILNKEATKLIEVCAPTWYMSGYCARFSITDERIVNQPGLDCTQFNPPCPTRFLSNSSAKYQTCYSKISSPSPQKSAPQGTNSQASCKSLIALIVVVCIVILILVIENIVCVLLYKKKLLTIDKWWKRTAHRQENAGSPSTPEKAELLPEACSPNTEETANAEGAHDDPGLISIPIEERNTRSSTNEADEKENTKRLADEAKDEKMDFKRLSGKSGQCSIKVDTNSLWIVEKEMGVIYDDDRDFADLKKHQNTIEVVIGNSDRTVQEPECDVISKKSIFSRRCEMNCAHLTTPDTLFAHTRSSLKSGSVSVQCPECKGKWGMEELIEKCAMSDDETIFFTQLVKLNKATKEMVDKRRHV